MTDAAQSIQLSEKDFEPVAKAIGSGDLEAATSVALGVLGTVAAGPIVGGLAAGVVSVVWKLWQNRPKQRLDNAIKQIDAERAQQAELQQLLYQVTLSALSVPDGVQAQRHEEVKSTVFDAQSIQLKFVGQEFSDVKQQLDELKSLVTSSKPATGAASSSAAPTGLIDNFRNMLATAHKRLWGLFSEFLRDVDSVYVELELVGKRGAPGVERGLEFDLRDAHREWTLRDLVQWPSKDGVAPRWVVSGDPGAGKTTLARHLTWEYATVPCRNDQQELLAIYASLPRLAEEGGDPFDQAQKDFSTYPLATHREQLGSVLRELAQLPGRVAWLLDGLDEVPANKREALRRQLDIWAECLPQVAIVVLTRPIGVRPWGAANWQQASVRALDATKQDQLLERWLGSDSDFVLSPRVREVCTTPLTLTLLACLIERRRSNQEPLPTSRLELYRESIDTLLRSGQRNAEGEQGVHEPAFTRVILAELSLCLHQAAREVCGEAELLQLLHQLRIKPDSRVAQHWQDPIWRGTSDFLKEVSQRSGLFGAYDGDQQPWKFLHRQLGELLAAEALLAAGKEAVLERAQAVKDKPEEVARWAEVLGFACELDKNPL